MSKDSLSDEDKAVFREYMRSVTPLAKNKQIAKSKPLPGYKNKKSNTEPDSISLSNYFLSDFIKETVYSDTLLSYCRSGMSHKQFSALKKGHISWEAKLDLHGFNTEDARNALKKFISTQNNHHKRCLLIIHGKGSFPGTPPVLKNLVNRWLPQFEEILAFHSAQAKDGGYGAVYVLLKKNKSEAG